MPTNSLQLQLAAASQMNTLLALTDTAQAPNIISELTKLEPLLTPIVFFSEIEIASPALIALPPYVESSPLWQRVSSQLTNNPASLTLIASPNTGQVLHDHLAAWMLVQLPTDNTEMVLALWDPIVLAALLGNPSDTSLYVTGPILTRSQREAFLVPINSWWYSARDGDIHQLVPKAPTPTPPLTAQPVTLPLLLTQQQLDALTDVNLPDQLLAYLYENQSNLIEPIPQKQRYETVRAALSQANQIGLQNMRDRLNYICATLIYGTQMHTNSSIRQLLQQVHEQQITLTQALEQFP